MDAFEGAAPPTPTHPVLLHNLKHGFFFFSSPDSQSWYVPGVAPEVSSPLDVKLASREQHQNTYRYVFTISGRSFQRSSSELFCTFLYFTPFFLSRLSFFRAFPSFTPFFLSRLSFMSFFRAFLSFLPFLCAFLLRLSFFRAFLSFVPFFLSCLSFFCAFLMRLSFLSKRIKI